MSNLYNQSLSMNFSPARTASSHIRTNPDADSLYLAELMQERQKLGPFMQVLPICNQLLNQEISRLTRIIPNQGFSDYDLLQRGPSPMNSFEIPDIGGKGLGLWNVNGWNGLQHERVGGPQGLKMDWQAAPGSPSSFIVKRILRLDIPVDSYPNFNFVGRLLGPRGNSLKRVEASTGCRVYIRGKGSIKDPEKEESLMGRPGYEHLNEPLHILIEAELPVNIIDVRLRQAQEIIEELLKPVYLLLGFKPRAGEAKWNGPLPVVKVVHTFQDETRDLYKRRQLRELAMLNSNFREESPRPRGSVSPFGSSGMKRAKTGW